MPKPRTRVQRACERCGAPFTAKPSSIKRGGGRFCSISCGGLARAIPLKDRFRQHVGPPTETGCTPWTGAKGPTGYGHVSGGRGRCRPAHRVAWELVHGPIPEKLNVLHRCDNRSCVNVDHLFLGTQADNVADMIAKDRHSKGEMTSRAKLTAEVIARCHERRQAGETLVTLAAEYGVRHDYLCKVLSGIYWKHLVSQ